MPHLIGIVDDDQAFSASLGDLMRSAGYTIDIYATADDLLACGSPAHFDCILTDVNMPGRDGIGLLQAIRAVRQGLPVIVMTADPSPVWRDEAFKHGAQAFLEKPFDTSVLLSLVEDCLRHAPARG